MKKTSLLGQLRDVVGHIFRERQLVQKLHSHINNNNNHNNNIISVDKLPPNTCV